MGKTFLKKLAEDENQINYNNLVFKIDDSSIVESVYFIGKSWYTVGFIDLFTWQC